MSIGLWVLAYLTWCAFLFVIFSISDFRKLVLKNRNLELALKEKDEALREAENYITEQHETLNQWSEAYAEQGFLLKCQSDLLDEWSELDVPRKKYDSFKEIDDLLVQSTTKEFIRLMAWKRASEEKAKLTVVNINVQKDLRNLVDDITDNFNKIKGYFSEEGLEDIQSLIDAKVATGKEK